MTKEDMTFQDILDIVKRRKWSIIGTAAAIFLVAVILAVVLPRKYRSEATILIESQEVPSDYVQASITSYADQRLQTINQRIMGTPKLLELINRYKLYTKLKDQVTTDEIVDRMRKKDIEFKTISADVVDPRSGRPAQATIAFSVSFRGPTPEAAQQVASELSSLYIEENQKGREQQSQGTSKFLLDELKPIETKLNEIEARISAYKQKNITSLPELAQINLQAYDQTDRDIRQLHNQLRSMKEQEGELQAQLANTPKEFSSTEKENLKQLKMQLIELQTRYSDKYPDVVKIKSQIREAEKQLKAANIDTSGTSTDNPAYLTLKARISGAQSEIASLQRQITELTRKRDSYQSRVFATPKVEEGYKSLVVERDNLKLKYDDLSKKAMEAKVAHGLEKEQLAERFTLVDPARLPEKPSSPNVPAILLIGLILGIGSGVCVAAIQEIGDQSLRSAEELTTITGFPVLVTIPEIITANDLQHKKRNLSLSFATAGLVFVIVVVLFHFFVMDFDVLWAKITRKVMTM